MYDATGNFFDGETTLSMRKQQKHGGGGMFKFKVSGKLIFSSSHPSTLAGHDIVLAWSLLGLCDMQFFSCKLLPLRTLSILFICGYFNLPANS